MNDKGTNILVLQLFLNMGCQKNTIETYWRIMYSKLLAEFIIALFEEYTFCVIRIFIDRG